MQENQIRKEKSKRKQSKMDRFMVDQQRIEITEEDARERDN